jgi:hypothetical protein
VIAAVRGESASLGRWKKAYREATGRAELPPPPAWASVVHETWSADAVLPWSHLRGPLPASTLRQHHDQALAIADEPAAP